MTPTVSYPVYSVDGIQARGPGGVLGQPLPKRGDTMPDLTRPDARLSTPSRETDRAARDLTKPAPELPSTVASPDPPSGLFDRVSALIERGRRYAAAQVNAALTFTYWQIGRAIDDAILAEQRADYGKQIVMTLGRDLTARFGNSYSARNLRRMIQCAREFPDQEIEGLSMNSRPRGFMDNPEVWVIPSVWVSGVVSAPRGGGSSG